MDVVLPSYKIGAFAIDAVRLHCERVQTVSEHSEKETLQEVEPKTFCLCLRNIKSILAHRERTKKAIRKHMNISTIPLTRSFGIVPHERIQISM